MCSCCTILLHCNCNLRTHAGVTQPKNISNSDLCDSGAFLANVNSRTRSLYAVPVRLSSVRLSSVVGNARAPYSGGCNFRQFFYGVWYSGQLLTCTENFMEIVPGKPRRRGS